MKHLEEYIKEQLVDEGKIGDKIGSWFKGFWEWLIGSKETKEIYDPSSNNYDPSEKLKYINKYSSDAVRFEEVENKKILDTIIERSFNEEDLKSGFYKLKEYFKKHPDKKNVNNSTNWISGVFKSDDLTESCALIGITSEDVNFKGKNVVFISEFIPLYKNVINLGDVVNSLKKFDNEIIIKDKNLISQLTKEEISIIPLEGQKDYFKLD